MFWGRRDVKTGGANLPGKGPAAVWLTLYAQVWLVFSDFWAYSERESAHGPRGDHPAHGSFPPPNNKQVSGHMSSPTWAPVSQHRWTLEMSQFSCVLGGSTSLWPKGSASILHLLAGLSCAAAVSFRSTGGSREPFRSWLGSLGWLHPLELLSGTGGGPSATGWEGPLDWTGSGLMGVDGCVWLLSVWWIELWLITPGKKKENMWLEII